MMLLELRVALRTLAKAPAFLALAVLTMSLGVGTATILFSVTESVLWRPLPFPESERLVVVGEQNLKRLSEGGSVSPLNFRDWRSRIRTLEGLAAASWGETHNLTGSGIGERVTAKSVSAGFFETLRVQPSLGRTFRPDEERPAGIRPIILSHALWQRTFAGSPSVVGQTFRLDAESCTVIGVMPAGFRLDFASDPDIFLPLDLASPELRRINRSLLVIGRSRPGIPAAQVSAEVQAVAASLAAEYPEANANWGAIVENLRSYFTRPYRQNLFLYLGFSVLVLSIACANVAGLLLVRSVGRRKEFALRTALGAGRASLLRQTLAETAWIAIPGGTLGAILAAWGVAGVRAVLPADEFLRASQISMDARTLAFVLVVTLASAFSFSVASALSFSPTDLDAALRDWGKSVAGSPRTSRRIDLLIAAEVTLAFLLLFGAGLFLSTHARLQQVRLGFDPRGVVTMRLAPGADPRGTPDKLLSFSREVMRHAGEIPGVESAALASALPLTGTAAIYVTPADRPRPAHGEEPRSLVRVVSPEYFRTLGIPLLQGRAFAASDSPAAPRVAVVNQNLARLFFGDANPVGRQLTILAGGSPTVSEGTVQIVGLAANTKEVGIDEVVFNDIYLPYAQAPQRSFYIVAKTGASPDYVASALRRVLRSLDPDGALYGIVTMEQRIHDYLTGIRFNVTLVAVFAALAVLLAGVGVYGAIGFSVAQRTREFGLRMALGAQPAGILSLTLVRTVRLTLAGAACGFALAWILGAFLKRALYLVPGEHGGMLYGVGVHDPVSLATSAAIMLVLAALAGLFPAARASRIDPLTALRHD